MDAVTHSVLEFDSALVRKPAPTVTNGLRSGSHDGPAYEALLAEHSAYVAVLEQAGLTVEALPPLECYPDSIFVEDPAFVLPEGAIVLRPGTASREGEAAEIAPALLSRFEHVLTLSEGYVDGGDILVLPKEILVGLSKRTDHTGAESFARLLWEFGRQVRIVEPPPGALHLKTACSLVNEDSVVATPAVAEAGIFDGMRVIVTPSGEEPAANLLRLNDSLLISTGFDRTADLLSSRGLNVIPVDTTEIRKLDAGLSCMSLRWSSGSADKSPERHEGE
jgi:dimethylargininase